MKNTLTTWKPLTIAVCAGGSTFAWRFYPWQADAGCHAIARKAEEGIITWGQGRELAEFVRCVERAYLRVTRRERRQGGYVYVIMCINNGNVVYAGRILARAMAAFRTGSIYGCGMTLEDAMARARARRQVELKKQEARRCQ